MKSSLQKKIQNNYVRETEIILKCPYDESRLVLAVFLPEEKGGEIRYNFICQKCGYKPQTSTIFSIIVNKSKHLKNHTPPVLLMHFQAMLQTVVNRFLHAQGSTTKILLAHLNRAVMQSKTKQKLSVIQLRLLFSLMKNIYIVKKTSDRIEVSGWVFDREEQRSRAKLLFYVRKNNSMIKDIVRKEKKAVFTPPMLLVL